ncbi:hypothetical protein GCM10008022_01190 [Paenibacillus hunanensis]|nr:hypothetical protein GCM10008022_01190 [Paenibacillus hunanensis]
MSVQGDDGRGWAEACGLEVMGIKIEGAPYDMEYLLFGEYFSAILWIVGGYLYLFFLLSACRIP